MKTVPITEKDQYVYIAIEDLGDGMCRIYEPGEEELLGFTPLMQVENKFVTRHQMSSRKSSVSMRKQP